MSSLFGIGGGGNVGAAGGFYSYSIDESLRFPNTAPSTGNAYLNRTPSSSGNRKTWTWSAWVKRSLLGNGGSNQNQLIWAAFTGTDPDQFRFGDTNDLEFYLNDGLAANIQTNQLFRDVSSWYHIVLAVDTTQATASDRVKFYVNGEQVTSFSTATYPSQNHDTDWNHNCVHAIGQSARINNTQWFCGYLAEVNFIDGTALDPTSFGETINGVWVPKAYSGSYGTNGFYLSFADSSAIGDDLSGNTNDWTANNLAASDVVPDSPTNNWCTFNPLDQNDVSGLTYPTVYSEGNLKLAQTTGFVNRKATFGMTGGKWYWEIKINDSSPDSFFGVSKSTGDARGALDNDEATIRLTNGDLYTNGAATSYGTAFSDGDVCILAVDMDAGKFWAGRNGTWFASGDPAAGTNEGKSGLASELFPSVSLADNENCDVNFGQNGTFNGTKTAGGNSDGNGYGDFLYTVPSGFLALCTANLPEPTIGPNSTEQADDYFNTVLYTGDGTNGQAITAVGHQPDLVWIKSRSGTAYHELHDSVRGAGTRLFSNDTAAESTVGTVSSFDSDGFTVSRNSAYDGTNQSGVSFVGWNWKAGGTAVSNTDGDITSSVSAAPDAGFSIVSWSATNTDNQTIGHGLSATPELIISKSRNTAGTDWWAWAASESGEYGRLNSTGAWVSDTSIWYTAGMSSTTFGVRSLGNNYLSRTYVAYCFHSVDGYSKVGSYVGNGSADGTFVYTGFRPAFVMIKNTADVTHWALWDTKRNTYNVSTTALYPSSSDADQTSTALYVDFVSNGFKWRASHNSVNGNNDTFIYLAFAEAGGPFKYSRAR